MKPRTAGWALWLLVGGLAAAVTLWQLAHPPQTPALTVAGSTPEQSAPSPALPPFALPPLEHYSAISVHPLFIVTRQPEPPPEDAPPVEKPPAGLESLPVLLGVMITPRVTVALVRSEQPGAKTARVKIGEMIGEWRLETVFPKRVLLRKDQTTRELSLVRPKKPVGPHPGKRTVSKPPAADGSPVPLVPPAPPQN